MTRLLVTDLDATIVFDRTVSPADREAMARWRAAGNLLAVDTGKFSFATRDVLAPLGIDFDYGVVFTGAVLIDGDYQVLSARFLPDGVARDVAARTVDLPGVTTYATTIETDYILADNNEEISSILAVFEHLTLEEMDSHRFIGVPLRVTDGALRERLHHDLSQRWEGVLDCHRNQEFLDVVPAGATKGAGLRALLDGPLRAPGGTGYRGLDHRRLLERPGHARRRRPRRRPALVPAGGDGRMRDDRGLHGRAHHHDPGRRPA